MIQKTESMVSSLKEVCAKIFASMLLRHVLVVSSNHKRKLPWSNITSLFVRNEYEKVIALAALVAQSAQRS